MAVVINDNDMEYILGETRFYFAQCVFNVSCHYAAYDRIKKTRERNQKFSKGVSIFTILVLVGTVVGWECQCSILLQTLSLIGLALTAVSLAFEIMCRQDLTELMLCHKQAAQDYMTLRDKYMDIIRQIKQGRQLDEISKEVQLLLHDYDLLGAYALATNGNDYSEAQNKLGLHGSDEGFTWSSQEIDRFLPIELREK